MNRTIAIVGGVVVLIVAIGLVAYAGFTMNTAPPMATSTPIATVPGTTAQTATDNSHMVVALPTVITNSTAAPSNTAAVLNGWVTPNGAFTNYWYEYGTSPSLGSKSVSQMVGSGYVAIATPAFVSGLAKDTTYYFRLVGQNSVGTVTGISYSFQTSSLNAPPTGSLPTVHTFGASTIIKTGATLAGDVTPNQALTQYWFEYGTTPNLGNTTTLVTVGNGTATVSALATLSNLAPLTTYYYRVNAENVFGIVNGAIQNFKTTGPVADVMATVMTGSATNIGTSTAMLRGTLNPNGVETTYWFEFSTDGGFVGVPLLATPHIIDGAGRGAESLSATITGLVHSTTYYFRLVAQSSAGVVHGDRASFRTKQ